MPENKTVTNEFLIDAKLTAIEQLLKNGNLDPSLLLTMSLGIDTQAQAVDLEKQKELISLAFKMGANLDEVSFTSLNFSTVHIEILKILLEHNLDPQALVLCNLAKSDSLEVLKLAIQKGVQIPLFVVVRALENEQVSLEVFKLILEKSTLKLDQAFTADSVFNEMKNLGSKFEMYLNDISGDFNDFKADFETNSPYSGTILHIAAQKSTGIFIKHILSSNRSSINALNAKGQTALFFAATPEIADILISEGIDTRIEDVNNNIWLSCASPDIITYAIGKNLLPKDYMNELFKYHFIKGNFERAQKIFQNGDSLQEIDPIEYIIRAIEMGLANSIEKNKHAAVLHLMDKAGIPIPAKFQHLRYNVSDSFGEEEFAFAHGFIYRLATHYVALAKYYFQRALSTECSFSLSMQSLIDKAFAENTYDRYQYFKNLIELCPGSITLKRIESKFDSYFFVAGVSLVLLDNDFALEVLTVNGMLPPPLVQDIHAYRGLKMNITEDDIMSLFKYGHRAFSIGEFQKFFGFYVNEAWNNIAGTWELGGTYVSLDSTTAADYAQTTITRLQEDSILIEILLPRGTPRICGGLKTAFELALSSINGDNILAIYKLDVTGSTGTRFVVSEAFYNPYIFNVNGTYKPGDDIQTEQALQISTYDGLGCKELPADDETQKLSLYQNYNDFVTRYAPQHTQAQVILERDYFSDRPIIENAPLAGCDPEIACC